MRLTTSQLEKINTLAKSLKCHSVKIEQLREVTNATCAVRVTPVGAGEFRSVDVAITGNVRFSKDA